MRGVVVDVHLLFKVLAGVGEVQTQCRDVRARLGQVAGRVDAYHLAAERHHDVGQLGVASDAREVARQVHRAVIPQLHAHHGEVRAGAEQNFDVLGQTRVAVAFQHHQAACVRRGFDDGVSRSWGVAESAAANGAGASSLTGHRDEQCRLRVRQRVRAGAIFRGASGRDARVINGNLRDRHAIGKIRVDRQRTAVERPIQQIAELGHRRELPDELAAGHFGEVGHVARAEALGTGLHRHAGTMSVFREPVLVLGDEGGRHG